MIFSDEKLFYSKSNHKIKVKRTKGSRNDQKNVINHCDLTSVKVNVWGWLAYGRGVKLVKISNNFNSKEYKELLEKEFGDNDLGKELVFLQDNCPRHKAKDPTEFFKTEKLYIIKTSPVSPDLNCIENVWNLMDRKLKNYLKSNFINNENELFIKVNEFANQIPIETINKLVDSTQTRIKECFRANGKATRY